MLKGLLRVFAIVALLHAGVPVAGEITSQPVQFAKGQSSATITGKIKGYQGIDYTLRAKAGQTMSVQLKTVHDANYFNILPPGSNDTAIFIGSISGNEWMGALPTDGEYKIPVYLMRSAARRHESATYTLTVGITGTPRPSDLGMAPAGDARVEGTPYHATGPLPSSPGNDLP